MIGKVIKKKWFRILLYVLVIVIVLPVSAYFSVQSPAVQTWLTHRIAGYFSSKWKTEVRIQGVDIEFFTKVVLEGVYVEDLHKDTLLYADKLKLDIQTFDRDSNKLFIRNVILKDAAFKLKKYNGDSALNLQFIIDEFASKDTLHHVARKKWDIGIGGITLDNVRFAYRIESDTIGHNRCINFSDILLSSVSGKISNVKFDADTTLCTIQNLSCYEKSGFHLKDFYANASISSVQLQFKRLKIVSNNSQIAANISFKYKRYDDFNHFIDSVKFKAEFNSSNIEMADIAYFAHELNGIQKKVFLNGDVTGKISDLRGKNIFLAIGDETSFRGNLSMTGLPDVNQLYMSFDAKELRTSKQGIEKIPIPPFDSTNYLTLPDNVSLFGTIKFKGNFSGFYNDFVSYGTFNTALGQLSTDISLKTDTNGMAIYNGKFACTDFNIGKFFEIEKYFGLVTMNVNLEGKGLKKTTADLSVDGSVNSLECYGYNYKNIDVKGKLAKNIFDGTVAIKDENADVDFNGNVDMRKSPTRINFNSMITKANLSKLNLMNAEDSVSVSAKIGMNAVGNNLDDFTGKLKLNNVLYSKGKKLYDFKDLVLAVDENEGAKKVDFESYIADAHLSGKFKPIEVVSCLHDFLANYFPSRITKIEKKEKKGKHFIDHIQEFSYDIKLKNMDPVTGAFFPSFKITTPVVLSGRYNENKNDFAMDADFPEIKFLDYKFKKLNMIASSDNSKLSFKTTCQRLAFADSAWIDNLALNSSAAFDTMNFKIDWHNNSTQKYDGNIPGYISFSDKPKIKLKLLPSYFTIADSTWKNNEGNEVVVDSSFIHFSNMNFFSGNQKVKLEGNISQVKEDQMYLMLSSFSLSNFNVALKGTGFALKGTISGNTSFSNIYDKPILGSNLDVQDLQFNKEKIGNGSLASVYDSRRDVISFSGEFKRDAVGNMNFYGHYFPSKKDSSISMDATVNDFHLNFFEPFTKDFVSNLKGTASAELQIHGTPAHPLLTGTINTKANNVHVNYLGTDYHFDGAISVQPGSFDFSNVDIYDENNNLADIVNGKIYHTNFKNFQLDFDLSTKKFLCLNTMEKDNSTYYGKVFATGILNIYGYLNNVHMEASIKSDKAKNLLSKTEYSQLSIPLSGSQEVGENSFVTFVKKDSLKTIKKKYKINTSGITLDFKIEPTADAQVQLIFDEKVGDVIKAKGTGNVEMVLDEFGSFKMYGDYVISEGDYLFTLKNVVNKKFKMEKGGTIHWSGNPSEADININAIYSLRASLSPLFPYETSDIYKKRYPVNCVMDLTGKLTSPDIKFEVELPNADDFIRQQALEKFRNSENDLNKEVFALLVMNGFVPVEASQQQTASTGTEAGNSATGTSSEMLTSQLSNWLSQISKDFDIGVHYRPGDELNSQQVELALSTQLFNDKLTIDGTVANNSNSTTTQNPSAVVGDVNMDYKITDNGKLRVKAFNKANEGDILNIQKGPYTQGVGILYKEDFDTIGELFRRYLSVVKKPKAKT